MLNKFLSRVALLGTLTFVSAAFAYDFDFTNTLEGPVTVRIKLSGINEPWYYGKLEGEESFEGRNVIFPFQVNTKTLPLASGETEWGGRKHAFCLSQVQIAPYKKDKAGNWTQSDEYYDMSPYFVETNYFGRMVKAAAKLAAGAKEEAGELVKNIMKGAGEEAETIPELSGDTLSKFVKGVTKIVGLSLCKDRSFTIVPGFDSDGKQKHKDFILITNER